LDRLKEILDGLLLCAVAVDQIFARAAEDDLSCNGDLRIFFKTDRRLGFILIVEDDRYTGFRDASLSTLVDEVLAGSTR